MQDAEHSPSIIQNAMSLATSSKYEQAIKQLEELGSALDNSAEALYIKAVCLRKLKQEPACIDELKKVLQLDPAYVRAHQEMGHAYLALACLNDAENSYAKAVKMDAALIASWRALASLHEKAGRKTELEHARHQVLQLEQLHPALQAVKSNLNRGNLDAADQICRDYLQKNKKDVEGMRLLAAIAMQAKVFDDAEFILESAVAFEPNHIGARFDYSNVLIKRQKFGAAHQIAQQLNTLKPNEMQFKALLASTTTGVGDTDRGIALYQELIADYPDTEQYHLLLGHAEKTVGNLAAAIESYQKLYRQKPDFGDAFWSLANTKTYKFTDAEVAHMQDYRGRPQTSDIDKVHFNFALGKALEDRKDFDGAFQAYEQGNFLNKNILNYRAPEIAKRIDWQIERCNSNLFEQRGDIGCADNAPIFVVGLPRSGSTLLEQILASHSQVDGTLELPNIPSLVRRLQGRDSFKIDEEPQYPKILGELDVTYLSKFGQQYIDETNVFRESAPYFIDKMPNNFLHIGLIKLILPNAKIIDARRHPMACCFSNFKQLFAEGQEFTYGLAEVGEYYQHYLRLMDHWDAVLPGFVLRVQHEDVVDDLESQVRRILDFCDLPFEESCLEFYKTERNIRTPSSEQVRQPIYKTGLEQWRNFEPHLQPLIEALGAEVLSRYPIPK